MMIFSAPPYATISLRKIYFPSHFLYKFFPMFRSYARFGVLVLLCFSILAAFGLKILLEKTKSPRGRILITLFAFCLLHFEFLNIPPFRSVSLKPLPVYEDIAREPGNFSILVYPPDVLNHDLLAQRIHRKRFLNPKGLTPPEVREVVNNLGEDAAVAKLRKWDTRYLIVRDPHVDPEDDSAYWKNLGFESFEDLISSVRFMDNYELVKTYNNPRVYLFKVP